MNFNLAPCGSKAYIDWHHSTQLASPHRDYRCCCDTRCGILIVVFKLAKNGHETVGGFDEYMWVVWLTESHHWIEWMNHQSILFQWMSMTDGWFNQPIIPPSISLVFSAWSSKETHKTLLKVDRTRVIQLWDWAGWKRDWMWSLKWKEGSVVQDESLSFFTNLLQNDAAFSQSWNTAAKYVHVMQWTAIFIFCHKFLRNMCSIQVFMLIKTILWLEHQLCCRNDGTESYWHWQHSLDGVKSTTGYTKE